MFSTRLICRDCHMIHAVMSIFGRKILDFCKIYSVYRWNERVGYDRNVDDLTYIGTNDAIL